MVAVIDTSLHRDQRALEVVVLLRQTSQHATGYVVVLDSTMQSSPHFELGTTWRSDHVRLSIH